MSIDGSNFDDELSAGKPSWLHAVEQQIADEHEKREYRPVGVAIVRDQNNRILLVQSVKNTHDWSFPQGGIEQGEDVVQALFREVNEEVGIEGHQLRLTHYNGVEDLDAEPGRSDKRGFTKGKRYFFFELVYTGSRELRIQESELAGYSWVDPQEFKAALATTRAEKRDMMLRVLGIQEQEEGAAKDYSSGSSA